jgi:hypothetical protein
MLGAKRGGASRNVWKDTDSDANHVVTNLYAVATPAGKDKIRRAKGNARALRAGLAGAILARCASRSGRMRGVNEAAAFRHGPNALKKGRAAQPPHDPEPAQNARRQH